MASMSYCVIENTAIDLSSAVEKFKCHQDDVQSNPYERARLESLYESCKEFVEEYELYLDNPDNYIAEHSANDDEDDDY